jgi:NADPH:quinone reductase-like Zn-dependent oxidoreductase
MTSGRLSPAMSTTFSLADAPAAIDHVSAGRAHGKVALIV